MLLDANGQVGGKRRHRLGVDHHILGSDVDALLDGHGEIIV